MAFSNETVTVFLGNDKFHPRQIESKNRKIYFLHQVHGSEIVRCQTSNVKADGHWTDHSEQLLVIKTADCLPVFLFDRRRIMALHMGWRAFTHSLFEKAMEHFDHPAQTELILGPHIGEKSFQVDTTITQNILLNQDLTISLAKKQGLIFDSLDQKDHYYMSLEKILIRKARKMGIESIKSVAIDTYRSPQHFSHRRNRWRVGTNYSYIFKK